MSKPEDSLLDRMEHIAEEEEEDDTIEDDDESLDPEEVYGGSRQDGDDDEEFGSSYAGEDDDDSDDDRDVHTPLEYHWTPLDLPSTASSTDFQLSGLTLDDLPPPSSLFSESMTEDSGDSSNMSNLTSSLRGSFTTRGISSSRVSFTSTQSDPSPTEQNPSIGFAPTPSKRRVTIAAPSSEEGANGVNGIGENGDGARAPQVRRQISRRRQSFSLKSLAGPGVDPPQTVIEDDESSFPSYAHNSVRGRFNRKSTRRSSYSSVAATASKGSGVFDSVDSAISSLGQGGNSEWENVAAAAAVVAAGPAGGSAKRHIQFAVDEKVLVFINILNHTNSVDPPDAFTINPVNRFGFPPGEGNTSKEQAGPYVYLLTTVRKLHFDEDVPYYTVARADTGTEQRADTEWMEPIKNPLGIEAATVAASQTGRSAAVSEHTTKETSNAFFTALVEWPPQFFRERVVPFYKVTRVAAKNQITMLLYGSSPYYCKLRATGINLLVACSFTFLFVEEIKLAFCDPSADFALAIVAIIVWSILVVELFLEWLIRPEDLQILVESDKAYAPSTARNINSFHLVFEGIALLLFIPEFVCLFTGTCGQRFYFSGIRASLSSMIGPTRWDATFGRLLVGLRALRMFGLVRSWKQMWINNTYRDAKSRGLLLGLLMNDGDYEGAASMSRRFSRKWKSKVEDENGLEDTTTEKMRMEESNEEDQRLKKAATIGTALMVINSHRALSVFIAIVAVLPMLRGVGELDRTAQQMVDLLQANNQAAYNIEPFNESARCEYLESAIDAWLLSAGVAKSMGPVQSEEVFVLWAQVLPKRCRFQEQDGIITICDGNATMGLEEDGDSEFNQCDSWDRVSQMNDPDARYFADILGIRVGGIVEYTQSARMKNDVVSVKVFVNHNHSISYLNLCTFLLLASILALCLAGLTVLRLDAGRLVLFPLQRMLKIVVRYSRSPLSTSADPKSPKRGNEGSGNNDNDAEKEDAHKEQLGNFETEQLINAITKITDLLRKCWGVAGAGIISSNLKRTQDGKTVVFNPTVPGKQVYALFGFVAINGLSEQLRALDRDVMILINDVAKVVHDEVYRWSLGDSGQCNKNLGGAFLMVFRIGDFKEVHEKQARATGLVFNTTKQSTARRRTAKGMRNTTPHGKTVLNRSVKQRRDRRQTGNDTIQLASLPGIQAFADRALLGMLKSFAGIHRDRKVQNWKNDFRLGAGVGAYLVNIIIGMDAGWAVEGAVGSEYKIDATYLSPHVNMASRMMSASKQYGVTLLVSQAVEELLSGPARSKLRHLDTVYVKGSSVAQRIFTYDARFQGVDFFLHERLPEQSDLDAESYVPQIWETDPDLKAMRQHVTEDFETKYNEGKDLYLAGHWETAVPCLQQADDIMITTVLEEGYIHFNPDEIDDRIFDRRNTSEEIMRLRGELGDGACRCLIAYMQRRGSSAPRDWAGVRPLTSK